jgi:hypothetical protein
MLCSHCGYIWNFGSLRIKKLKEGGWGESREAFMLNGNLPRMAIVAEDLICHSSKKRRDKTNIPPQKKA